MSEKITVLESLGLYLTKRFMADGRVLSYDSSASFHTKEVEVKSLKGVAQLLRKLHKNPHRCVIRGKFVGEDKAEPGNVEGTWSRTKGNFTDQPLHWFMVDIDAFAPFAADPVREVEAAIDEFMVAVLPPAFRRASYYWHLSSSAGMPGKENLLKCHVHFWSKTPYTSNQLRAWGKKTSQLIDSAVFNQVQVHYTADPVFEEGRTDPVEVRSGWHQGEDDAVDLVIAPDILASARESGAGDAHGDMKAKDPSEKDGLIGLFHKAFDAEDVLLTLLDEFEQVTQRRYTWLNGGGTPEGVWVHDDGMHVASSHNTWPIDGLANLWDVTRTFKFGHLDQSEDAFEQMCIETQPVGTRPSDKAMYAWVEGLPEIKEARREEREGPFLRCKTLIEQAASAYELETEVAPLVRAEELLESDRVRLVKLLQTRYKEVDGTPLPVAIARRWLAPSRAALPVAEVASISDRAPEWARPWMWVSSRDVFINTNTMEEVTTRSFNAMHNRYMSIFSDENGKAPLASDMCLTVWNMPTKCDTMYNPVADRFFTFEGLEMVNTFRPDLMPEEPKAYSHSDLEAIAAVEAHFKLLFPVERERCLLLSWLAHNVQKPGVKIRWSPIVVGFPGDGKTAIRELLGFVMPGNVKALGNKTLESNFTGWATGHCVIGIDEVKMHNHNRYDLFNALKEIITNSVIEVHPKGRDPFNAPNHANLIFFSNFLDGIPATAEDRRIFHLRTPFVNRTAGDLERAIYRATGLTPEEYWDRLYDFAYKQHAGALRRWLREYDLYPEFSANGRAPMTDTRDLAISLSRSDLEEAIETLIEQECLGVYSSLISTSHLTQAIRNQFDHVRIPQGRVLRTILMAMSWQPYDKRSVRWGNTVCTWYYKGARPEHPGWLADELEKQRLAREVENDFAD